LEPKLVENTIPEIRAYFEEGAEKLKPGEFIEFWTSLSDEEKDEFRRTPLKK
jgi:hypothetical protein